MEVRGSGVILGPGLQRKAPPEGMPGSLPRELRTVKRRGKPQCPGGEVREEVQ